jgi:hypothetical protein
VGTASTSPRIRLRRSPARRHGHRCHRDRRTSDQGRTHRHLARPTLERNTDGSRLVEDHTLDQLKRLDAAIRSRPTVGASFPFRGKGVRIATPRRGAHGLSLRSGSTSTSRARAPAIVDTFERVITAHHAEQRSSVRASTCSMYGRCAARTPHISSPSLTRMGGSSPSSSGRKLGILPKRWNLGRTPVLQVPIPPVGHPGDHPHSSSRRFHALGAVMNQECGRSTTSSTDML